MRPTTSMSSKDISFYLVQPDFARGHIEHIAVTSTLIIPTPAIELSTDVATYLLKRA
jgi:hypothetical protein